MQHRWLRQRPGPRLCALWGPRSPGLGEEVKTLHSDDPTVSNAKGVQGSWTCLRLCHPSLNRCKSVVNGVPPVLCQLEDQITTTGGFLKSSRRDWYLLSHTALWWPPTFKVPSAQDMTCIPWHLRGNLILSVLSLDKPASCGLRDFHCSQHCSQVSLRTMYSSPCPKAFLHKHPTT